MLEVGQTIPSFTVKNQDEQDISPASLSGKWSIFYFYPKDDTPGCTVEAKEFTERLPEYKSLNAEVFGISKDSVASHCKFIDKFELQVELLSDPEMVVLEPFGAWGEKKNYGKTYMGVIRSTFIVDPNGVIQAVWKSVKAAGHAEKVLDKLKSLQNDG